MLTHEELARAHDRGDWRLLWEQAIPLVKFAIKKLAKERKIPSEHLTSDLLQEGCLTARSTVERWNPLEGAFSTWVVGGVTYALRDHIKRESSGLVGGRDAVMESRPFNSRVEWWTRNPRSDPAVLAEESSTAKAVRDAVEGLRSTKERAVLRAVFGIGQPAETADEFAQRVQVSRSTINRYLLAGLRKVGQKLGNSVI